jgi:hypothetical protein
MTFEKLGLDDHLVSELGSESGEGSACALQVPTRIFRKERSLIGWDLHPRGLELELDHTGTDLQRLET